MSHCGLARYNDWSVSTFCMSGTWFFWNKLSLPFLPFLVVKGEILFIFWSKKIRFWWPFVIFQFGKVSFLVIFDWPFGSIRWHLVYILVKKVNFEWPFGSIGWHLVYILVKKGQLWLTFWFNQMTFGLYFGEKGEIWLTFWFNQMAFGLYFGEKKVNFDWYFVTKS